VNERTRKSNNEHENPDNPINCPVIHRDSLESEN